MDGRERPCLQSVPCRHGPVTPSVLGNYSCAGPKLAGLCLILWQLAGSGSARAVVMADSCFHDNGVAPEILPLEQWKQGWRPDPP
jgi:hypothetical protein